MLKTAKRISTVKQGEFRVSSTSDDLFLCVLGSCIATCFYDPFKRIGGMNHFLLPGRDPGATGEVKYGAHAMEELVNALLRAGASKDRMLVSLFGGAKVIKSGGQIGANNAQFAREFVSQEGFRLHEIDVGGAYGRRLSFHPAEGITRVEVLRTDADVPQAPPPSRPTRPTGSIELF